MGILGIHVLNGRFFFYFYLYKLSNLRTIYAQRIVTTIVKLKMLVIFV